MIDRFNFYDLYGYLIPGLVLVVLIWIPWALVVGFIPDAKLASVAAALAGGYIIGHFLQSIASQAIASTVRDAQGQNSYPSVVLLNRSDETFTEDLKTAINARVNSWFRLDVKANEEASREIERTRQDAFFLCRQVVNQSSSYSEQHQGLYSLMRGLVVAFPLGASYSMGWVFSAWKSAQVVSQSLELLFIDVTCALVGISILKLALFLVGERKSATVPTDRATLLLLAVLTLAAGYMSARDITVTANQELILLSCSAMYVVAALRFYISYRVFANEFAKAIWRHFAAEPEMRPSS